MTAQNISERPVPQLIAELQKREREAVMPPPIGWPEIELPLWVRMSHADRNWVCSLGWGPNQVREFANALSRRQAERRAKREAAARER